MKNDSPEETKKSEKIYINKQTTTDRCRGFITFDNTRKELIRREKKWEKNWAKFDYLCGENVNKVLDDYIGDLKRKEAGRKFPPNNKSSTLNRTSSVVVNPSPAIPTTSSAAVGWRSSLQQHNLEIFHPLYISPTNTVISLTSGDLAHQKFIFLG